MDNLKDTVKQRATAQLDTQKGRATDSLAAVASAVRHTSGHLRADQHDTIAQYIDSAADQLERFSTTIRNKDVNELMRDARQLARRQPALFVAGTFAVGLLAARFLKSSQRSEGYDSYERGYASGPSFRDDRSGVTGVDSWSRDASEMDRGRF